MKLTIEEKFKQANEKYHQLMMSKKEKPNHKYVKSFQHLINIVNTVIENAADKIDMTKVCTTHNHYYDLIYMKPFCDQYTWLIKNDRPDLLMHDVFQAEFKIFTETNKFCGKNYTPPAKVFVEVPEHLKDK
jgi:hypothetical protein